MKISRAQFVRQLACIVLAGSALYASPALAQRGISSTSSGNDPTLDVAVTRLVNCELLNTDARINGRTSGGAANACSRVSQFGETLSQVQAITTSYNAANPANLNDLLLLNTTADRLAVGDIVSSGGLFTTVMGGGLGGGEVGMRFLRGATGSFVMAFSGIYDDGVPGNAADLWSAYYLFDDVQIQPYGIDNIESGLMNYRLFEKRSQFDPFTGLFRNFRDFTRSLVVNQVSIYQLASQQRVGVIPEPGTWALIGAGLFAAVATRRRMAASAAQRPL